MLALLRDLRHGIRLLRRSPGFAATAVLTLALGIGATTALFSVVHAVLIEALPFPKSQDILQVWRSELPSLTYGSASYPRYLDWAREQRAFTEMGAWAPRGVTIAGQEGPERVPGAIASASFFRVMGASPVVGRWYTDEEDRRGGARVAVISEGLWRRRYQASASALGATALVDGEPYTVIGVAPSAFSEIWRPEVWLPLGLSADPANRGNNYLMAFGRLRPGATLQSARTSLADLAAQMTREHPEDEYTFTARPLHEVVTEGASRGLWVLLGATGLLLLIACTNVANLLLARSVVRERDLAIRASLGAGRGRLIAQVMAETLVLGLMGSVAGLALAWALLRVFVTQAPQSFPRLAAIDLDLPVLLFSFAVAMVAGATAGLAPAISLARADLNAVVQSGSGRAVTAHRARRASRLLVVSEVALALALVTTAGLMTRSLLRLQSQDLGVTREPVLTFSVGLPRLVADGDAAVVRFQQQFADRVRALPGVSHVSAINMLPVAATGNNGRARRDDQAGEDEGVPVTEMRIVMGGYFQAMGVRLLAGRAIEEHDRDTARGVAVVNETLASRLWPGLAAQQIVGRRVLIGFDPSGIAREVIGIVASVRSRRPDAPPDPELYVPFAQVPSPAMSYVVRSAGDPSALTGAIRRELASMTPHVALAAVRTFDDVVATANRTSGLLSWLSVLFGALAAGLAILGIYSVMSYTVAQRERELAIRAAVGASRITLLTLVMREGLALSVGGIVAGAALAWVGSGVLRALLFETSATDPLVFAGAAAMLALAAAVGYLLPAARASRVEPVTALRSE